MKTHCPYTCIVWENNKQHITMATCYKGVSMRDICYFLVSVNWTECECKGWAPSIVILPQWRILYDQHWQTIGLSFVRVNHNNVQWKSGDFTVINNNRMSVEAIDQFINDALYHRKYIFRVYGLWLVTGFQKKGLSDTGQKFKVFFTCLFYISVI